MNEFPKETLSYEPSFPWMREELTQQGFLSLGLECTIWHILGTLYQWAIIPAQDYSYHYLGRKRSAEMHKSILTDLSGFVFFLHTYFVKNIHIF